MVKVQVLGATNCKDTRQSLDHLRSLGVEHEFIDIDRERAAEQRLKQWNGGERKTPTLVFSDNIQSLSVPSNSELDVWLDRVGLLSSELGDGSSGVPPAGKQRNKASASRKQLGFSETLSGPFDEIIERTKEALKAEGFGVLSEIAIHKALRDKLGIDVPRQVILGACNPQLAYKAMQIEPDVSLFLPCNVVVREFDGGVKVLAVDAEQMLASVDRPELQSVAQEANARLKKVIGALSQKRAA